MGDDLLHAVALIIVGESSRVAVLRDGGRTLQRGVGHRLCPQRHGVAGWSQCRHGVRLGGVGILIRARISLGEDVPLHVVGDGVIAVFAQTVQIVIREALVLVLKVVRALCQVACVGIERIALVQNHRVRRVLCRALCREAIGVVLVSTRHGARLDLRYVAQGILRHALIHHRRSC